MTDINERFAKDTLEYMEDRNIPFLILDSGEVIYRAELESVVYQTAYPWNLGTK